MNIIRKILLIGCSSSALLATNSAYAQTTESQAVTGSDQASEVAVGEIVVTANKREESASRVGVTLSAMTGDMLSQRNIATPSELASVVPGLALADSTHGTPVYTLRGVGYNADALGVYPAVSLSIDQAPMPFPVLALHSMYDLERVEVLKGPQGTLFGQNSTGGQINYIAAKPTSSLRGGAELGYGRFNDFTANGYVSGPMTDTLGFRIAVDTKNSDGWQINRNDGTKLGAQNYFAGRMLLKWDPSSAFTLTLNVNGSIDKSEPTAPRLIGVQPSVPSAPTVAELTAPLATGNVRVTEWSEGTALPKGDRRLFQASLRADYSPSDAVTFTSLTTFNHLKQRMVFDYDGSSFQMVDGPKDDGSITDFSQELRLSNVNQTGSALRWTLGANYNYSKIAENQWVAYADNSLSNAANIFINISGINSSAKVNTYAAFGNLEYDVLESLTVRAGVRYTKSVNDTNICGYSPGDGRVAQLFTILGQILGGQTIPLAQTDCYTLNAQFLPGQPFIYKLDEDNVSWKVGLDYRISPETLVYTNVSRGYKAGSFPAITAALQKALIPARQESVTSYEAGIKTRLAGGALRFNSAIFYQDYRNKQVQGTLLDPLFGLLQQLQNVPKSHIFGVEADVVAKPLPGLTLTGSASYLKTKVDTYTSTDNYGHIQDFAGNRLPFAPEWTLIFDVDYRTKLANGGEFFLGGTVNFRTSQDAYIGARTLTIPASANARTTSPYPFVIDGYTTIDARLGYTFPGDHFTLSVWGKNLTDKTYATNKVSNNDVIIEQPGMPVTYGVTLKASF